jgi:hypothetical protein
MKISRFLIITLSIMPMYPAFYVGVNLGVDAALADRRATTTVNRIMFKTTTSLGAFGASYGIFGGYKNLANPLVYGIELALNPHQNTIVVIDNDHETYQVRNKFKTYLKFHVGFKINSTILYGHLGPQYSNWKSHYQSVNSVYHQDRKPNPINLSLGFGIETSLTPRYSLRLEYTHTAGPILKATRSHRHGISEQQIKITQSCCMLGLSFNF